MWYVRRRGREGGRRRKGEEERIWRGRREARKGRKRENMEGRE